MIINDLTHSRSNSWLGLFSLHVEQCYVIMDVQTLERPSTFMHRSTAFLSIGAYRLSRCSSFVHLFTCSDVERSWKATTISRPPPRLPIVQYIPPLQCQYEQHCISRIILSLLVTPPCATETGTSFFSLAVRRCLSKSSRHNAL